MGKSSGVWYEIFVRSFRDSNGDGIGDLNGITEKLDYLKGLGIRGIWLTPINPSPTYHGYDVNDYEAINPQLGTLADLRRLVSEAHRRGIKLIIDLVINHTSTKHPWFVDSASGPKSAHRAWYTWAEDTRRAMPTDGAIGSNPWHLQNGAHYLGIFWGGMPDLNYDNTDVRREMVKVGQFWLKEGVDGFRLDAARHIYEDFQSQVRKPEIVRKNVAWWQEFRRGMDRVNPHAYIIGEITDSTVAIAPYLDRGLDSCFDFDLAQAIVKMCRSERDPGIAERMARVYAAYSRASHGHCVDAPFLTNHDQPRVMTELGGNVDHAKMAASVLLTLPGNPFIYYGEEIGMKGAKPDPRLREPMCWSDDENAAGTPRWERPRYRERGVSVEAEEKRPDSLLSHYRRMIALRNSEPLLADSALAPFATRNTGIFAYVREKGTAKLLVVHNLTAAQQSLDARAGAGSWHRISFASKPGAALSGPRVTLPPYCTVVLK